MEAPVEENFSVGATFEALALAVAAATDKNVSSLPAAAAMVKNMPVHPTAAATDKNVSALPAGAAMDKRVSAQPAAAATDKKVPAQSTAAATDKSVSTQPADNATVKNVSALPADDATVKNMSALPTAAALDKNGSAQPAAAALDKIVSALPAAAAMDKKMSAHPAAAATDKNVFAQPADAAMDKNVSAQPAAAATDKHMSAQHAGGNVISGYVIHTYNPEDFYVLPETSSEAFATVMAACAAAAGRPLTAPPQVAQLYLTKEEGNVYRVRLDKMSSDGRKAKLFFLDTGRLAVKPISELQQLVDPDMQDWPGLARRMALAGLQAGQADWSEEMLDTFSQLIGEETLFRIHSVGLDRRGVERVRLVDEESNDLTVLCLEMGVGEKDAAEGTGSCKIWYLNDR